MMLTVIETENTLWGRNYAEYRVMKSAPPAPSLDQDLHFVLCGFGRAGLAYVETDPTEADATTIVRALLRGLYDRPLRVIAVNAEEGGRATCQRQSPPKFVTSPSTTTSN